MGRDFKEKHNTRTKYYGDTNKARMHSVVCDKCGKDCEVPFKPSTDKPVYCSRCFEDIDGGSRDRDSRGRDSRGRDSRGRDNNSFLKEELVQINTTLNSLVEVLASIEKKIGK